MKLTTHLLLSIIAILAIMACSPKNRLIDAPNIPQEQDYSSHIQRITEEIDTFFAEGSTLEVLADNLKYADGPLWLSKEEALLFSEVERNTIDIWTADAGVRDYVSPSGYTGDNTGRMKIGSRGLALDKEGNLVICQPGDYTVSIMAATLSKPYSKYLPLFQRFLKKEMYGPTDIEVDSTGNIYFTDPAPKDFDFKSKEKWQLPFSGVYSHTKSGKINLINDELSVPSGLALSPDQSYLIISNGDPSNPYWQRSDINSDLTVGNTGIIYRLPKKNNVDGLPDGLTFHESSYLFATGPGGVWVFNPKFELIGKVLTSSSATDCTFNHDYSYLYITTRDQLLRIPLIEHNH